MRIYNVQWIAATHGEQHFCTQIVHVGSGCLVVISQLAFIQGWPLREGFHCTCLQIDHNYHLYKKNVANVEDSIPMHNQRHAPRLIYAVVFLCIVLWPVI